MEALKKAVKNREAPIELEAKGREKVLSFRASPKLEELLKKQAEEWNKSLSETVRAILNFYFLPPLLLEAWEKKVEALSEQDIKAFGEKRDNPTAPTLAQRIEPVLVDTDEAEEYAQFINSLWEKNEKYFETLREEGIAMNEVAIRQFEEAINDLQRMRENLPEREIEL
ncbi:MAG TPA: hypothetical protein PKD87_16370 [Burkholderiaceae bacterium]|nr:hypothetical protein [Burkholderiaceae bacterium]